MNAKLGSGNEKRKQEILANLVEIQRQSGKLEDAVKNVKDFLEVTGRNLGAFAARNFAAVLFDTKVPGNLLVRDPNR